MPEYRVVEEYITKIRTIWQFDAENKKELAKDLKDPFFTLRGTAMESNIIKQLSKVILINEIKAKK